MISNEERKARNEMSADTLKCLHFGWGFKSIGEAGGAIILRDESRHDRLVPSYKWHAFSDNGGEFNVSEINGGETKSVPYTDRFGMIDGGTMAYRVACAIRGDAVDYDFRCPDLIEDARKAA